MGVSKKTWTGEEQPDINMGRIRLEEVTSTNLTLLRDINQKIFPILTVTDMSANQWSQFVKKDSGFAFLAYWNDMLAGAVCCQLTDNNGLYLRFIGTLNRHRRKGVAKKLMQRVLQEAQERDVHNIISYVRNDNKAAIHINQKFGFGITSNDKRDPSLFVMEKMLHINNPAPASVQIFSILFYTVGEGISLIF